MSEVSKITIDQIESLEFPLVREFGLKVVELSFGQARVELPFQNMISRPGSTVNGPAMMCLADYSMYLAIMTQVGLQLQIVTSNLNIDFLRRPPHETITANAQVLKLGRKLAVGRIELFSTEKLVAHCTCTYSL